MTAALALIIVALATVGVASAIEVAFLTIPRAHVRELKVVGQRSVRFLETLRAKPAALLAALWVVRAVGVAIAVLSALDAATAIVADSTLVKIIAVSLTILLTVPARFVGRILGHNAGIRFCLAAALPVWIVSRALLPVTWPAALISKFLAPKFPEVLHGLSDGEILDLVGASDTEPVIEEHERQLIERAFRLDQTTAYDVMTPRVDIIAWPDSLTLAEIASDLRTVRYSRIPLYDESIDKITGVLYSRSAYQALISGLRDVQLKELAREPTFVPGSLTLDKLLLDFQSRRIHMGIVIDEYGAVDGLIALEDILEELVGEIEDESDVPEDSIVRLSRNVILVDGGADLREINHFFNTTLPLLEHRSLNGFLLDVFGQVPQPGDTYTTEGVLIEVTAATDTQVVRARLSRVGPGAGEEESRQRPAKDDGGS